MLLFFDRKYDRRLSDTFILFLSSSIMTTSTRRKQTDTIIPISNPSSLIPITSFDSIPLSRYFFNPTTNDILLYLPISNQYKLVKPTVLTIKSHTYNTIALIPSDNSKRIKKSFDKFSDYVLHTYKS